MNSNSITVFTSTRNTSMHWFCRNSLTNQIYAISVPAAFCGCGSILTNNLTCLTSKHSIKIIQVEYLCSSCESRPTVSKVPTSREPTTLYLVTIILTSDVTLLTKSEQTSTRWLVIADLYVAYKTSPTLVLRALPPERRTGDCSSSNLINSSNCTNKYAKTYM